MHDSTGRTQVCMKTATNSQNCRSIPNKFTDVGSMLTQIGNGFYGYISQIEVIDQQLVESDLNRQFSSSCSANVNGASCSICPALGEVCIGTCGYENYGASCEPCYADCRSCYDQYWDKCYSCIKSPGTWTFTNTDSCYSTCGDGVRDDWEKCDDGNTAPLDGCDNNCLVETPMHI